MGNQDRQFFNSFMLTLGVLISLTAGQLVLASSEDTEELAPTQTANNEVAAPTLSGLQVYNEVCVACHSPPGIGGAPALGDSEAWATRISNGIETLKDHALNGFSGGKGIMPKKGGRLDLSDEEISSAVAYMVEQATE